jgi:hypothetical protein
MQASGFLQTAHYQWIVRIRAPQVSPAHLRPKFSTWRAQTNFIHNCIRKQNVDLVASCGLQFTAPAGGAGFCTGQRLLKLQCLTLPKINVAKKTELSQPDASVLKLRIPMGLIITRNVSEEFLPAGPKRKIAIPR